MTIRIHKANQPIIKNDTDELYISSSRWKEICNHLNKNCYDLTVTIEDEDEDIIVHEFNRIKNSDHVIIDINETNFFDLGFVIGLSAHQKKNIFVCIESLHDEDEIKIVKDILSFYDIAFYDDLDELLSIWFTQDY